MANRTAVEATDTPRWCAVSPEDRRAAMYAVRSPLVWRGLLPRFDKWLNEYATPEQVMEIRDRLDTWERSR